VIPEAQLGVPGIGAVRLRLVPTPEEVVEAEREKRARGFFLHLVETLLLDPPFSRRAWAALPEEALLPIAARLAEANGLSALFRPKREKPFYNAFRNAWRMSRADHNEAAFQRAIAVWKSHLAAGLAEARRAYDRAISDDRGAVRRLAEAQFVLSPRAMARTGVREALRSGKPISAALCALFTDEALADLMEQWFDSPPFRERERFIRNAFAALRRGETALAIYGLLPQPEGVLWDLLFRFNPAEPELEQLVGAQSRTFITVEALIREILSALAGAADLPLYRFVKFVDFVDDGSFNRHTVEHGASTAFATRENALRLILFLDFVHFALAHLLPESRRTAPPPRQDAA
jgi:hypothetical protein